MFCQYIKRGIKTVSGWIKVKKHKVVKRCALCGALIKNPHQNKLYCDSCLAKMKVPNKTDKVVVTV